MQDTRNDADLITIRELADWLGWSVDSLYRDYRSLGIPFVRVGGSLRWRVGAVREWIKAREADSVGATR